VSLSFTFDKNEKIKYHIKIKTYKFIVLRFWTESDVNVLCGWSQVSSGIRANGSKNRLRRVQYGPCTIEKNDDTEKAENEYLWLGMLPLEVGTLPLHCLEILALE